MFVILQVQAAVFRVDDTIGPIIIGAGVTIVSVADAVGVKHELTKDGDRVVAITWSVDIKPGEASELSFVARNPKDADQIAWKVHQRHADGTSSEWVGPAGSRGPAPTTKLVP